MVRLLNVNRLFNFQSFPKRLSPFLKDVLSTIIIQILIMILNVMVLKIASMRMSIEDFGLFNLAKRSASLAAYVLLFGLGISIPKFISGYRSIKDQEGENRIMLTGIIMVLFLSLLGLLMAFYSKGLLAAFLFGNRNLEAYVLPLMLNIIGITLSTFITAYYRGINNLWLFNLIQFVLQLTVLLIIIFFTLDPVKIIGWWGVTWITFSVILLGYYLFKQKGIFDKTVYSKVSAEMKKLIRFGAPRIFGEFALFGIFAVPLIILSSRDELSSVALISVPISFFQLISAIFGFAGYVLLPHVSAGIANGNFSLVHKDIKKLEVIYLIGSLAVVIIMIFSAPFLTRVFFSADYLPTVPYTRLMCIGLIPYTFYLLYRNPLDAVSHFPWNSINLVICLAIVSTGIRFSHSLQSYALFYVGSTVLLGLLSWGTWKKVTRSLSN